MTILLELLRRFWPYLVVGAVAATTASGIAWKIQGLRLTAAEQEFAQYKLDQAEAMNAASLIAEKKREDAANEFRKLKAKLNAEITTGEVYRRCVIAGRCGGLSIQPVGPGIKVPPPGDSDGPGPNAVPSAPGATAEAVVVPQIVVDCTVTTLMLNRLQADIEAQ